MPGENEFCSLLTHIVSIHLGLSNLFHSCFLSLSIFKDFIYLFDRQRSQVGREAGREEEEAGSPLSREPDAGLDPKTLGS